MASHCITGITWVQLGINSQLVDIKKLAYWGILIPSQKSRIFSFEYPKKIDVVVKFYGPIFFGDVKKAP